MSDNSNLKAYLQSSQWGGPLERAPDLSRFNPTAKQDYPYADIEAANLSTPKINTPNGEFQTKIPTSPEDVYRENVNKVLSLLGQDQRISSEGELEKINESLGKIRAQLRGIGDGGRSDLELAINVHFGNTVDTAQRMNLPSLTALNDFTLVPEGFKRFSDLKPGTQTRIAEAEGIIDGLLKLEEIIQNQVGPGETRYAFSSDDLKIIEVGPMDTPSLPGARANSVASPK